MANDDYEDPNLYAQDKLANAEAQLEKLEQQKDAIDELIKAVKKDLRAAKVRAKAERIQQKADNQKENAAVLIEQAGVAIDLPNLMAAKGVRAGILENQEREAEENVDLMFKDQTRQESVFFPSGNRSGINNDAEIPSYIK